MKMIIKGLEKLTTIDFPGKTACTVFLGGCNFRCGYCHNPELVISKRGENYPESYVFNFLEKRKGLLEGVCISGGEPTLQPELKRFIKKIKNRGFAVKLDTNGSNFAVLQELKEEELVDYVAMDVKGPEHLYPNIIGKNNVDFIDRLEKGMAITSQFPDYEFRTTVVRRYHGIEEIKFIAKWLNYVCGRKPKRYCLQGFENQGKFIDPSFMKEENVEENYLIQLKKVAEPYFEKVDVRV